MDMIYTAHASIRHRRYTPKINIFNYQLGYVLVDIDKIADACGRSPVWSHNRFNLISLYDKHLLTSSGKSIRTTLTESIQLQLGQIVGANQPIYVLTLPSYLGLSFNPVSFYWIYDADEPTLQFIAAHITNTPWHERFLYCFACQDTVKNRSLEITEHPRTPVYRFVLDKQFHVSPFMPMDLKYDWRFKLENQAISTKKLHNQSVIHMQLKQHGKLVFDATMQFKLKPLPAWRQHFFPVIYPLQSIKVVWGIYWQAFGLFLKKIPFFSHPKAVKKNDKRSSI